MKFGNTISLKDNFTSTMRNIIKKQKEFKDEAEKVDRMMDGLETTRKMNVNNNRAVKSMREVDRHADKVKDGIEQIDRSRANPLVSIRDRATSKLKGIKDKIKDIALNPIAITATIAGVGAGAGFMLKQGADLEQQEVAMRHFISVNNPELQGDQLDQVRDNFINTLRENANATPFKTSEVVSAGARAINVAQGDTNQAMELVKLAENMAALNPEKSLQDAIEALADLKVGEGERMKEFGFKITSTDMAEMMGASNFADLSESEMLEAYNKVVQQKLSPYFEGGAEKLATTGAGLFSTIMGKLGSRAQDIGRSMLDTIKKPMQDIIQLIDTNEQLFKSLERVAVGMFDNLVNGAYRAINVLTIAGATIKAEFGDKLKLLRDLGSGIFEGMSEAMSELAEGLAPAIDPVRDALWAIYDTAIIFLKPAMDGLINAFNLVGTVASIIFPFVAEYVMGMYDVAKPFIDVLGDSFQFWADKIALINDKLQEWEWIHPFLQGMAITIGTYLGLMKLWQIANWAVVTAQVALNSALLANPYTWVLIGIGLLVGAGIWLVRNWDMVKEKWNAFWDIMSEKVSSIVDTIKGYVNEMVYNMKVGIAGMLDNIPDIALPENLQSWKDEILSTKDEIAKNTTMGAIEANNMGIDIPKMKPNSPLDVVGSPKLNIPNYPTLDGKGNYDPILSKFNGMGEDKVEKEIKNMSPISIGKLAEKFEIREEADIDKITEKLAEKIVEAQENGGGVGSSWSYGY